ncbi:uncharacterized protein LOC119090197 [Pollicipes pollicipes]|uniref:uncharacterized protein LOC119090197 n=1 Tax=Pollicipes pollicipes TaxID=41117 RepID=UPI0018853B76|nr:uncharacterized protein LOC119090197 [Pollicipes pollicipes]
MRRNTSVTTRIHQPPAPPCWFRTLFYGSFCFWVVLQAATEYYTTKCLHTYTHLPLFENEKQVDSAFLNIVAVGLLTVLLVLSFIYGILAISKLVVLASAAFLATLLILNILAVGILMSCRFTLKTGPVRNGMRIMTIYHKNASAKHWYAEMDQWAAVFPGIPSALPPGSTPAGGGPPAGPTAAAVTAAVTAAAAVSSNMAAGQGREAGNVTVAAAAGNGTRPPETGAVTSPPPADATTAGRPSPEQHAWSEEYRTMPTLGFYQNGAYCCGVESVADYATHGAQIPPSCRCKETERSDMTRPSCSVKPFAIAGDEMSAVWSRGCLRVRQGFLMDLFALRDFLAATVVFQFLVMMLGVVLGLNMPDSKGDDSDDEGGDY